MKEYKRPEMIITSYNADSEIMLKTTSQVQLSFKTKNFSVIEF